ncbi:dual specificity protein phosphatase 1B-like [Aricia agestis]|uniref:dual specificity protein phosphatase 1B-like n=1 Tax=Aricia agestis TaxID=91739 RepID=UPI001C2067E4|nr:dual specificity protein phosphatase 1B-like [Aricia agestis]
MFKTVFTAAYNQQVAVFASLKNWTRKALYNEIDLFTQACYSQIIPGLYLSNARAAADKEVLRRLSITHILTVENRKLPRSALEDGISNLFIKASDTSDTNLLRYFPLSNSFIDEGLSKGNVIVHCHFGVSRSATLVIAYLMYKYRLPFDQAYNIVKQRRKFIHPNPGFVRQLKQYERANYRVAGFKKLEAFCNVNARNIKIAISVVVIFAAVFIPIALIMTLL